MLVLGIFCHYFSLLGLLRCLLRIHFCRNLHTFLGKIILAQNLLVKKLCLYACLQNSGVLTSAVGKVQFRRIQCRTEKFGTMQLSQNSSVLYSQLQCSVVKEGTFVSAPWLPSQPL